MASDPAVLLDRARVRGGLDDFGDGAWRLGFERLVEAIDDEVDDVDASERLEENLVERLVQRLRIESWYAKRGEQAARPVVGPLVILGLPRTATTALHHLLSADRQFRYLRSWEVNDPVPPPVAATEYQDPRRPRGPPRTDARHIVSVDGPVEDWPIHALAFDHGELTFPVPAYSAWWRTRDHAPLFPYLDRVLRLLHSHRPPTRWLLKMPAYVFLVREFAAHYPDASFVMTHRDPVTVMASTCSVVAEARRKRFPTWRPSPSFGPALLEHWADGMRLALAARDELPDDRFVDIAQRHLQTDGVATARRIYRATGLQFDDDVGDAMADWLERNRRGARGEHRYSLEEYGLTADEVTDAFAAYLERFGDFFRSPA